MMSDCYHLTVVNALLAKAPKQRAQVTAMTRQEHHTFAYLTMKNINFAQTFFIYFSEEFSSNLRHEMTCFAVALAFLPIPKLAAFSSGVLRRLLQRNTKIDYLSCVSGGGYTGSAYVDWKYRNNNVDEPKWHQEFFEHVR